MFYWISGIGIGLLILLLVLGFINSWTWGTNRIHFEAYNRNYIALCAGVVIVSAITIVLQSLVR